MRPYRPSLVSIIVPTLNAQRTLRSTLESIARQSHPAGDIEILLVDGGSTDDTLQIAHEHGCTVLANEKVQQEFAKHIGLLQARGEYIMFVDSDEVLDNPNDIRIKVDSLRRDESLIFVGSSGYRNPPGASPINDYINLFADPFAHFMYRMPYDSRAYVPSMRRRYAVVREDNDSLTLGFATTDELPLMDLAAGVVIDSRRLAPALGGPATEDSVIPQLLYRAARHAGTMGLAKHCAITHDSSDTLARYLRKLMWRVVVNVHYPTLPGTGFSNRLSFQHAGMRFKRLLFIPYAATIVGPAIESVLVAFRRSCPIALIHAPLSFLLAMYILFQMTLKCIGIRPRLTTYGGRQELPAVEGMKTV
jgi:glycosyltransferase involved in cell wall biosynthesis